MLDSCPLLTRVPRLDPSLYGTERDGQESSDEWLEPTRLSGQNQNYRRLGIRHVLGGSLAIAGPTIS